MLLNNIAFRKHLKLTFLSRPIATILLVLSFASALFCADAMFGYGHNNAESSVNGIAYQAFSLVKLDKNNSARDTDYRKYISDKYGMSAHSILYFYRQTDGSSPFGEALIVGYDGDYPLNNWWAPLAGRNYFLQTEVENGSCVVYVSDSVKTDKNVTDCVTIGSNEYNIIGSTIIVDSIISQCLPASAVNDLFPESNSASLNFRNYYIMPYSTFCNEGFLPDFVIIRMDGEETQTIRNLADVLFSEFTGIEGAYPKLNTEETKKSVSMYFGIYGIILCIAAWAGATGILVLWIKSQLRNSWIFISCGLTRFQNILWFSIEILIITVSGKILSLLTYYLLADFWKSFNVAPAGFELFPVLSFLTLFFASVLITAITSFRVEKSIHNYE